MDEETKKGIVLIGGFVAFYLYVFLGAWLEDYPPRKGGKRA